MRVLIRKDSSEEFSKKCNKVMEITTKFLSMKNVAWLLDIPAAIKFDFTENRSFYTPHDKTITIANKDEMVMVTNLIHELGHVLMSKQSLLNQFKISFKHIIANKEWYPSDYAKQSSFEMFAEMFLYYIIEGLEEKRNAWMAKFLNSAKI